MKRSVDDVLVVVKEIVFNQAFRHLLLVHFLRLCCRCRLVLNLL
jgi:hypothetical protein